MRGFWGKAVISPLFRDPIPRHFAESILTDFIPTSRLSPGGVYPNLVPSGLILGDIHLVRLSVVTVSLDYRKMGKGRIRGTAELQKSKVAHIVDTLEQITKQRMVKKAKHTNIKITSRM